MASSTTTINSRKFIVKGQVKSLFTPDSTEFTEEISNLEIELWQKSPLDVFLLGKSRTDTDGNFVITFEVDDKTSYLNNGLIENVFAKIYYKGEVISGENPYLDDASAGNRPIKDITLREGLTDIGTHQIEITRFEYAVEPIATIVTEKSENLYKTILFDIREAISNRPLPVGYTCEYRIYLNEPPYDITVLETSQITTKEGYAELLIEKMPVVLKKSDADIFLNLNLAGIPDTPAQNCYLRLDDGMSGYYYTLITDIYLHNGNFSVRSGNTYYPITDLTGSLTNITAISVTETGVIAMYNSLSEIWSFSEHFTFYQFEFPENFDVIADGIYGANGATGTITSGQLGSGTFEPFSLSLENKGLFPINVSLKITLPEVKATIFDGSFTNLLPGDKNFVMVETDDFPQPEDNSPDLEQIETLGGTTFSTALMDFLEEKELTTLAKIRKAGPIRYIDGFPDTGITEEEIILLQAHTDLYTVNTDAEQNQYLITKEFDSLYKIAETPKEIFLDTVEESEDMPLFEAITIYEKAAQNLKLVTNLLSGKMGDLTLRYPSVPNIEISNFAETAFSKFENRCECEDCTSAVSPFSYYVDLLKYGAKHITKTTSPTYYPVNYNAFLTLLENYFFQPFGSFAIDCSTLHKEYCRLRLVTEVLEQYVATKTLPTEVADRLEQDRKNFILLTYKTLLTQAGTSYEEVRKIIAIQDEEEQKTAAQSWSDKLGIPLYVPETVLLTVKRVWLTFTNSDPDYELNAENLELIFGFRDTQHDVLTNPPASLVSEWKESYLFTLWKRVDFPFSAYSREDVDPSDDNTFKPEWKPIIDPDSFGRSDMTYLSSDFALALWRHRKEDTDDFLLKFVTDSAVLSRTSADIQGRILRIPEKNLKGVEFQNSIVRLKNPIGSLYDVNFGVYDTALNGTSTDIILRKPTEEVPQPAMFQSEEVTPVMRYDSVIPVIGRTGVASVVVDLAGEPIVNALTGGQVQLVSSGSNDVYSTANAAGPLHITLGAITVDDSETHVELTLDPSYELSTAFTDGSISFIYEAEVMLDTASIPDPDKICNTLFGTNSDYTYLPPVLSGLTDPFTYKVWDIPVTWPGSIGAEPTYYKKLKKLYEIIRLGTTDTDYLTVITDNLHTTVHGFSMLMDILLSCEQYLGAMYSYEKPDTEKLYQMASVLRNCARLKLNEIWVKEEIKYLPSGGTNSEKLMLDARYFWKSLNEPKAGFWDSSLQTIPDDVLDIASSDIPIIDPELVARQQLLISPDAEIYCTLYDDRQTQLDDQRTVYFSWLEPFNVLGFTHILNHINTGDENEDYDLAPEYNNLEDLISDFESTDEFRKHKALQVLEDAFRLTADAFSVILPVMEAYKDDNPANQPNLSELHVVTDLFVTAFKRKRLYFTINSVSGWIEEEVTGTFLGTSHPPVKYYNVLEMRLDTVRGNALNRSEWQRTLADWNRIPTVFPDIVPPENINHFVQGETVHDLWISRKNTLDNAYDQAALGFNDSLDAGTLFANYKIMLSTLVVRAQSVPTADYSHYITDLFEKEDTGEDIRPYLNQLNIFISEYRVLRQVYEVLESENATAPSSPSGLLPSEYDDIINISIRINFANAGGYFSYVNKEYEENVVLTGADFQNYTPSIVNFPLEMVQETTKWRSPNADKKAWKDTLESRINRKQSVFDDWETVLEKTEDTTMSVMRDALIQALRNSCESLDDAKERLARTLFIETKDNCCMKHSRVSHAIETVQGLIFALENGIYDDYLNGFTFVAPNFKKEWEWIGSYATWRSAVFVYLYPENLLYPTLKKRQSPAFIELAETLQNANRFSALDACKAAKKYQNYFEDIQNLKMVCTANARAYIFKKDPLDCCGDLNNSMQEYMTYYIGQSTTTGKGYYSEKPFYTDTPDEHDFWKEIPTLPKNTTIIGCLPLNREYDSNGNGTKNTLWLFYTYKEDGDFKLAYLKKDLMTAGSDWTEEETADLPDFSNFKYETNNFPKETTKGYTNHDVVKITLCQNSYEWDFVYFVFSFGEANKMMEHIQFRYDPQENKFSENLGDILFFTKKAPPVTALVHWIKPQAISLNHLIGITLVFEDEIQTAYYGSMIQVSNILPHIETYPNLIGAFRQNQSDEKFVVAALNMAGQTGYAEVNFTYTIVNGSPELHIHQTDLTTSGHAKHVRSIAPRFNFSLWEGGSAVTAYSNNVNAGMSFRTSSTLEQSVIFPFVLTPEKRMAVAIESGECIQNYNLRTANIKDHLRANLNAPQGNPISPLFHTSAIREVLYEAYYFVPMLLALDQQQRGDYPTALEWYRSVYDYTANVSTQRKIFYGLVLEQSVANVYDRPADWLLDPLNPHLIAQTRTNAYTKYTLLNIIQCMLSYADREFTIDTVETVPNARKLYSAALDLLKVSELAVKPSKCETLAHNCFPTSVTTPIDMTWDNTYSLLQAKLGSIDDIVVMETASAALATIFNDTGTMEEKFTDAFTYLASATPEPVEHTTVNGLMGGINTRMNDAFRYLLADVPTESFNQTIKVRLAITLASMTGQAPEQVPDAENTEKINWLIDPVPNNAQPLEFQFINAEGKQQLPETFAYNPMQPSVEAFQTNLVFANAPVLYSSFLYEENFTPFIDYSFCLPSNPVYSALELKANLELFKIHNCRNIAGMERSLDIFTAPTDSTTGVPVIGAGGNLVLPGTGAIIPSQYRFRVLMERAKQLVSQAQQLESQFLSTLEKEDAENYSQLRARQDLQTAKSTVKLQDLRVKQSLNEETVADLQLDKMQFVQNTYNGWINAGLNGYEIASIAFLSASIRISTATGIMAATASIPTGLDPRSSAAALLQNVITGLNTISGSFSSLSSLNSQLASYERRKQEWQYQSDLAGYDISIANQQIKIAEQNTRIVSQEREIASLNMDHATDTLEFLKTKFTNAELYRWMGNVLERTYSYMLNIATAVAKTAEQQYYFEQQEQAGPFILTDYWEVPQTGSLTGGGIDRRGMTGSARLLQDITRLDQYAFETTKRKLQMTKVISLGQLYPDAFQTFIQTGVLNFDLTDRLFDYDFPGHYLRLINGVKVSVIGLIPVYDNIKATLTAGTTSYTVIEANNTFQRVPIRRMETDQVALTGASRATGLFEFQPAQGELLNPFEGMGIESRWEFKMPKFSNRMDYSSIADVLIEVDYTALDSFQYRYQVLQDIDNTLGFSRGFSFKNDYPDQWYELSQAEESTQPFSVEIELKREQFPQGVDDIRLDGSELLLHFVRKDGFTDEVNIADFNVVSSEENAQPMDGVTVNGTFKAGTLSSVLNTQSPPTPFVKLRLAFANTPLNRELFSEEHVTDILLLVNCKADLPVYPL